MKIRIRTRTKSLLIAGGIGATVVGLFFIGTIIYYVQFKIPSVRAETKQETINEIEQLQKEEEAKKTEVWKLNEQLLQGQPIDLNKLYPDRLSAEEVPEGFITDPKEYESYLARIDLGENLILTNSMLVDMNLKVTDDLREQDYSHITIPYDLAIGDYVDIRIKREDGTDDIVSAKKEIKDLNGSECKLFITEKERQYINVATVETALNGGSLYMTIYVDPENQPKAEVTYQLNEKILEMIEEDPEVVQESINQIIEKSEEKDRVDQQEDKEETTGWEEGE